MVASDYNYMVREQRINAKLCKKKSERIKRGAVIILIFLTGNALINLAS